MEEDYRLSKMEISGLIAECDTVRNRNEDVVPGKKGGKIKLVIAGLGFLAVIAGGLIVMLSRSEPVEICSDPAEEEVESTKNTIGNMCEYVKDKVAIIECADGSSGTGFCLRMSDGVYFISNEHVFHSAYDEKPKILTVTGRIIDVADRVEIAKDFDLIRWRIEDSSPCFELSEEMPSIGNSVVIYGNSDGLGVVTEIKGTVQGVSHNRIETDAKFVLGNSGSPLINEDGKVIGVAALLFNRDSTVDWAKKGTRFDAVRRFAERVPDQSGDWTAMRFSDFTEEVQKYADYDYFLRCFLAYHFKNEQSEEEDEKDGFVYVESCKLEYKMLGDRFHPLMNYLVDTWNVFKETQSRYNERLCDRNDFIQSLPKEGRDLKIATYDFITAEENANLAIVNVDFIAAKKKLLADARDFIGYKWQNPRIVKIADRDKKIWEREICRLNLDYDSCISHKAAVKHQISILQEQDAYDEFGTLMLYKYALRGNQVAQSFFVKSCHEKKLHSGIYAYAYWDSAIPWFKKAFQDGDKMAGIQLGDYAYSREKDVNKARNYWSATGGPEGFYLCGWSYQNEDRDGMALELYDEVLKCASRDSKYYELAKQGKVSIYLFSKNEHFRSSKKALRDLRDLLLLDSKNGYYNYLYGYALWNDGTVAGKKDAVAYIRKAALSGDALAEKFLKDNKEEVDRL